MLTEGRLADSVWRVEDKDYSNAAARRPFISFMLHRVSPLLAQSGHSDSLNQCPLLGVKRTLLTRIRRAAERGEYRQAAGAIAKGLTAHRIRGGGILKPY